MLKLYTFLTVLSAPILGALLNARIKRGKEDEARIYERKGQSSLARPHGKLLWIHAASVGEAQSALILITKILNANAHIHILVTTGTRSSAQIMASRLPDRAMHQYYPLDHPKWCDNFLNHWQPDYILWIESELWPNMLCAVQDRTIPAILINARLSDSAFKNWKRFPRSLARLLNTFQIILTQSEKDTTAFKYFDHKNVKTTDNIKYAAAPLPVDDQNLTALQLSLIHISETTRPY